MAVKKIGNDTKDFYGYSTDNKPTEGIKAGSVFVEYNTVTEETTYYMYDGVDTWNPL